MSFSLLSSLFSFLSFFLLLNIYPKFLSFLSFGNQSKKKKKKKKTEQKTIEKKTKNEKKVLEGDDVRWLCTYCVLRASCNFSFPGHGVFRKWCSKPFFFFRWFWEHDLQYLIDIQLELKNNLGKVFLWWNYFVFVTIAFMGGQWFNFSLGSSNWYFQFISLLNQDNKCYFLTVKKMTSYFMNAVDRSEILRRAHFMSWFVTGFPGTLKMIFKQDNFILIIKS